MLHNEDNAILHIEIKNINKFFNEKHVLKGATFDVKSGNALGILGRNGAGKTTALRIIMGVFNANEGEILVNSKPIDRSRVSIGYLPEERGLYPKKTVIDQLIFFGMLKNMTKADAKKSAEYWLNRLQMSEYISRRLDTLSKGNQQKIQLVATVISNPDIVILDEPFSGLDPVNAAILKDIVKELISKNKIVIFSSHQMNYIEEFCDNIIILNGGKIVLSGNIKAIKRSYDRNKIIVVSNHAEKICENLSAASLVNQNTALIHIDDESEKSQLLSTLANMNVDIDEIKVFEPSLNDIFVEYTQEGI